MRIFIGGLPPSATKDDLVRLFRQFGADDDSVVLPRDRRTRRRKGIAYVEIPDPDQKAGRRKVAIKAGISNGTKTEILAGLKTGDTVILQQ